MANDPIKKRKAIMDSISEIPPFDQVAHELIKMMGSDLTSAVDLDRVITNDQGLTVRVLKLANSSSYGKSREISSIKDAVVLLGYTTLSNIVLSITVSDIMKSTDLPGFGATTWQHSVDCAAAAKALARITGTVDPEMAFVTGLIHDVGHLIMACAAPVEMAEILESNPVDPLATERKYLGINHAQVGGRLLNQWNLPPEICEAVRFHHTPNRKYSRTNPLVNLIALADLLSTVDGVSLYPNSVPTDLFPLLKVCGIQPRKVPQLFRELDACRKAANQLLESIAAFKKKELPQPLSSRVQHYSVHAADEMRGVWHQEVLSYLGNPVLPWTEQVRAEKSQVKWVVADLHGMSPEERRVLESMLSEGRIELAVIEGSQDGLWAQIPRLPNLVTRRSLSMLPT